MDALPPSRIFELNTEEEFLCAVQDTVQFQHRNNPVYREYCNYLGFDPKKPFDLKDIPFLPIEFFKTHRVIAHPGPYPLEFRSSGTSGQQRSVHWVPEPLYYQQSFLRGFELFYGPVEEYCILALLPNYLEQQHSSLVHMTAELIKKSKDPLGGFYLNNLDELLGQIAKARKASRKILLLGVSFALLDLAEKYRPELSDLIIMETGGMKGRRKEMIRSELHGLLQNDFGTETIHSEYGMTELLSQSYSRRDGLFLSPPWKRILIRDPEDPLSLAAEGKSGGINIIDLANQYSCSFIATQDLGRWKKNGFEVLGRFDHAEVRGCNLMVAH